ncbi:uncharacterized protein MYCFIDRAFT_198895 [Pseudocercospora fijiensis CIRAD86]|uniref:Extracellular mutant protein 11 C-terminal domain-containing protein n=1 Tax=Pseudocercospora fijiensis (strain CIRAD86) TaxID=383855 RepID=M2ZIR3_PSEFD|nr:uncharacterized protein MYCFIDRAFT_198895 [Pseudocercospora fijiensis CIRAD86]EME79004.1 hypothetical protein MYCFIDRAFT_198895 [Pseudocercospora fijiensis CIRAD86]
MAKDNDQGLHRFVMRQHAGAGYDGQNDMGDLSDLKIGPNGKKGSASANMQTTRTQARHAGTRSAGQRDSPPHAQQNVFGTDASAADRTSIAESARATQQPKTKQQLENSQPKSRNVHDPAEYDDGEGEENYTHHREFVNQPANGQQQSRPSSGDARHEAMPHSTINKRLSGDSYPETTSGSPSTVDQNAVQDRRGQTAQYAHPAMRSRGPGARALQSAGEHVQVQTSTPQLPQHGALGVPNIFGQPGPKNMTALVEDVAQNFSFGPPPQAHLNMARPGQQPAQARTLQPTQQLQRHNQQEKVMLQQEQQQQQQVRPSTQHGHRSVPTDQAHHGSEEPPLQQPRAPAVNEPPQQPTGDERGETRSPFERGQVQLPSKQRAHRAETPLQQRLDLPSEAAQEYSDGANPGFNGWPSANGHDEQYPPIEESALDYEDKELFRMDYSNLKAQPFDADPHMGPFEFPPNQQAGTFDERLKAAAGLPPDSQADFLATLDLDQWEQAGDWFLDRFGELASRFKNARNAKRTAAREFENEIEHRHEMVAKKQKITEAAMNEMRESGGKVLQGTPKKTRKAK